MFQGFSPKAVEFLWNIRFNNYRSWYQEHKEECHTYLDAPMREFAAQLQEELNRRYPDLCLNMKVCRIYRDTRRLYGRPPYRDHMWFTLHGSVKHADGDPGFYFELAPEKYSFGMGTWTSNSRLMARLRQRIDQNPGPVEELARKLKYQSTFSLDTVPFKRPKGDPGPLLYPWYNSRYLGFNCDDNCEGILYEAGIFDRVLMGFRFLIPHYRFFVDLAQDESPLNTQ